MKRKKKNSSQLIAMILISIILSGCQSFSSEEFPNLQSKYANISFQYPRSWKLQKDYDYKTTTLEGWILHIPDMDSYITIRIREMSDPQEANEWFTNKISNYYSNLDPEITDIKDVEVCGTGFKIYRYYQPEDIEIDFIINESQIISVPFAYENVYYSFAATVLISELSNYDDIEAGFLSIIDSIVCE